MRGSPRFGEILKALADYHAANGHMPTAKQVCAAIGIHRGVLRRSLQHMAGRGLVKLLPPQTLNVVVLTTTPADFVPKVPVPAKPSRVQSGWLSRLKRLGTFGYGGNIGYRQTTVDACRRHGWTTLDKGRWRLTDAGRDALL